MSFKKAINIVPIWNTKELAEGSVLEGKFTAKEIVTGKFGDQNKYIVVKEDGEAVAVMGSASVVAQFNNVPINSLVRVTYKGVSTTKNGNTVKVYEVEFDDSAL